MHAGVENHQCRGTNDQVIWNSYKVSLFKMNPNILGSYLFETVPDRFLLLL